MPLINVKVIEEVFSPQQSHRRSSRTDAMVAIEGEALRQVTWCLVAEVASGSWGVGSRPLTTADVHALAATSPAH